VGKEGEQSAKPIRNHRDLVAWQVAVELGLLLYRTSRGWPDHERFGLISQIRRAGVSIAANIAEGNGRKSTKDYLRFLSNAYGSLMEVDTHLEFAVRLEYIAPEQREEIEALVVRCDKLLSGLRRSLEARVHQTKPNSNLPPPTSRADD